MRRKFKAGIPSWRMKQAYAPQQRDQWCWSASISMILSAYEIKVHQYTLARDICGIDRNGRAINCPALPFEISQAINLHGHDDNGIYFKIDAPLRSNTPDIIELINELIARRPVLVAYYNPGGRSSHAIVLTGCEYETEGDWVYLTKLIARDPEDNFWNTFENGRREIKNVKGFLNSIHSHWYVKVYKPNAYRIAS